jgi:DNA-directed RNA polymerase subunit RPC12/RpoP
MVTRYECKGCGADLEFDASTQALKCQYCGSTEILEVEYKDATEHDFFASPPPYEGWGEGVASVTCESCGATIAIDKKIAGNCAFCETPYVKKAEQHQNIIRPEHMVPFKVDNKKAFQLFKQWIGKGFFRPSALKKMHTLKQLHGVYMPFWTYDAKTYSQWSAMSGYYYYVNETYYETVGNQRVAKTRQVQKIRWVPSSGSRHDFYDDVLICASRGVDYNLVHKIYPFHLNQLVPYKKEYLSGWMAEEYAIDVRGGWSVAKKQVEGWETQKCGSEVPGDTHRDLRVYTYFNTITYKHILLPIWVASYHYKKKVYKFLINGQTGEVQGYAPISWLKVAGVAAAIACGVAAALHYFGYIKLF